MLPQATSLLIDKGGNRLRNWNLKKERDSFQTTLGGIRPHPSRAAPRHTWQKRETVGIFQFLMRCFFELFHGVVSESPQREWSTSAGTPGFFLPEIPAESALIITASLPPPPPPPKWRQREQQLGERSSALNSTGCRRFSHHFLLWILTSIVMNTLERCLTAWAQIAMAQQPGRWKWVLFARLCVLLTMSLDRRVTMWCTRLCVPVRPRTLLSVSVPLCWGQIWVICRIAGSPKMTRADRNN